MAVVKELDEEASKHPYYKSVAPLPPACVEMRD